LSSFASSSPWTSSFGGSSINSKSRSKSQNQQQLSPWGEFPSSFSTSTLPTLSTANNHNNNNRNNNNSRNHNGKTKSQKSHVSSRSASNLDFTEDPFKNYRYEDPFALSVDPFLNNNGNNSNNNSNFNDPFK